MKSFYVCSAAALLGFFGWRGRAAVSAASNGPSFVEFESGHVRPIALSPDGSTLFAVNTPNGTLEVFSLASGKPRFRDARSRRPGAGGCGGAN